MLRITLLFVVFAVTLPAAVWRIDFTGVVVNRPPSYVAQAGQFFPGVSVGNLVSGSLQFDTALSNLQQLDCCRWEAYVPADLYTLDLQIGTALHVAAPPAQLLMYVSYTGFVILDDGLQFYFNMLHPGGTTSLFSLQLYFPAGAITPPNSDLGQLTLPVSLRRDSLGLFWSNYPGFTGVNPPIPNQPSHQSYFSVDSATLTAVPEPSSFAFLALCLVGLASKQILRHGSYR